MMRKLTTLGLVCAFFLTAAPLSKGDREYGMSLMHSTRKQVLDTLDGLSPAQLNFKPAPDKWSILEVAEHIELSEETISALVRKQLMSKPANPEKKAEVKITDKEQIEKLLVDRSQKAKAPEMIQPKHKYTSMEPLITDFKRLRDDNIAYLETTQDDLHDHYMAHPVFGMLDGYQWMLMIAAHSERHMLQMREIKSDPNFPKK